MTQERTFTLELKNDQKINLKFSSIPATGDRLWQMFATTEALDTVDQDTLNLITDYQRNFYHQFTTIFTGQL